VNAETENVTAWKNEVFKFTNAPLDAIMREVEDGMMQKLCTRTSLICIFNFTVERNVPVSKLLHFLEETGQVHFKVEGRG